MVTRCQLCGREIPAHLRPWQRIQAWQRSAASSSRRGGYDVAVRQPIPDQYACNTCIRRLQSGVSPSQLQL
jgi:hypothetical protein